MPKCVRRCTLDLETPARKLPQCALSNNLGRLQYNAWCLSNALHLGGGSSLHTADDLRAREALCASGSEPPLCPPPSPRAQFEWDRPQASSLKRSASTLLHESTIKSNVTVESDPYEALAGAHGLAVLTEWDEFKTYDYERIYAGMTKPAFVFDGRNILDHEKLRSIGFIVYALGKPLDAFIRKA
jgi:UDP-glucose/GDP-mannose dehydrogenase family, UDP binding domain